MSKIRRQRTKPEDRCGRTESPRPQSSSENRSQARDLGQTVSYACSQDTQRLFVLGFLAHQGRQYETAISHYQRVLILNPTHTGAQWNLGVALADQGKFAKATVHYERALVLNPEQADLHNNLGVALAAQGRLEEAIAYYQRALRLKSDHADLHNNLALALSAQGRVVEAIRSYQRAIALQPSFASAHNNLGAVLADQGRVAEAISHFQKAITLEPEYANAYNNLGAALSIEGRLTEAIAVFERALVISPNHANARNNLGGALADQGRVADAALHVKLALALDPDHAAAHNTMGKIFTNQGKFNEALEHFGRAITIKPDYSEAHLNRALIKSFHRGDTELAALEELAASNRSPQKAVYIHFALAKALDDTEDYVRAFEHWRKGNALKRAEIDYDETTVLRQFERISTVFSRGLFDNFWGAGDPSSVPIFIVGMPRSGSTLVEQILASHPQIHGAGELTDFDAAARNVLRADNPPFPYPECVATLDATTFKRIGQAYLSRLTAVSDGEVRITDKLPGNFLNIGLIHLALPNARIIHTVRDPVATCLSCYSKLFTPGNHYAYDLAELGRFYRHYQELMRYWHSVLPAQTILDVSYEEVIADFEGQARRLIDYCGLPWDDRCASFHTTNRTVRTVSAVQVRKPLFRESLHRWRKYESEIAPLLDELGPSYARRPTFLESIQ